MKYIAFILSLALISCSPGDEEPDPPLSYDAIVTSKSCDERGCSCHIESEERRAILPCPDKTKIGDRVIFVTPMGQ